MFLNKLDLREKLNRNNHMTYGVREISASLYKLKEMTIGFAGLLRNNK
jgi:hypothetical protein